jgi:hypothetical protein
VGTAVHAGDPHRAHLFAGTGVCVDDIVPAPGERLGIRDALDAILILAGVVISEEKGATESMAVIPDHAAVPQARELPTVEEAVDVKI